MARTTTCKIPAYSTSMRDVRRCAEECGSEWFSKGAMRFFKSRIGRSAFADGRGGAYFVSSEQGPYGPRLYSVRYYDPKRCQISTVGKFQQYGTNAAASSVARRIAKKKRGSKKGFPTPRRTKRRR